MGAFVHMRNTGISPLRPYGPSVEMTIFFGEIFFGEVRLWERRGD